MVGKVRAFPFVCLFALCAAGCDSAPKGAEGTGETAVGMRWAADQKKAFDLRNGVPAAFDLGDSLFLDEFDVVLPTRTKLYKRETDDRPGFSWRKGERPQATLLCRFLSRYKNDLKAIYVAEQARMLHKCGMDGAFAGRIVLTIDLLGSKDSVRDVVADAHVDSSSIRDAAFVETVRKEALRWEFPRNIYSYVVSVPIDFVGGRTQDSLRALPTEQLVEEEKYPDGTVFNGSGEVYYPDGMVRIPSRRVACGMTVDPLPPYHPEYNPRHDCP